MYEPYWGLSTLPFQNVPDPGFFFPSAIHQQGLKRLVYTVEHGKGAGMLMGEIGCGKTTMVRAFMDHLPEEKYNVALITHPDLPRDDFLQEINLQFGIKRPGQTRGRLWEALTVHCSANLSTGIETVLIVDEAQTIRDNYVFEELCQILNLQLNERFLITLILIGQPELKERVGRHPQLNQRIAVRYHLGPFDSMETPKYVQHRLHVAGSQRDIFSPEALQQIWQYTRGVPRSINNVADLCLLYGFESQRSIIDGAIVQKAAAEFSV